jgi:hypothetical protein
MIENRQELSRKALRLSTFGSWEYPLIGFRASNALCDSFTVLKIEGRVWK